MIKQRKDTLQEELISLLEGESAHVNFKTAIENIPNKYYGMLVEGLPYTLWRVLQHMQLTQSDILDYITNPSYKEREYPGEYWLKENAPLKSSSWKNCVQQFESDLEEIKNIVKSPQTELLMPIPHIKNGPTLLHEILLLTSHNSYHIGQLLLIRGFLGIWQD